MVAEQRSERHLLKHVRKYVSSISYLKIFLWSLCAASSFGAIVMAVRQDLQREQIEAAFELRLQANSLADELRQSSDDLTRFARSFAATGDSSYRERFDRVIQIREGRIPRPVGYEKVFWDLEIVDVLPRDELGETFALSEKFLAIGVDPAYLGLLKTAKDRSDNLVQIESNAFSLIEQDRNDEALELLFSYDYHVAKAAIMAPIRQFQEYLDNRLAERVEATLAEADRINRWIVQLAAAALFLGILAGLVLRKS